MRKILLFPLLFAVVGVILITPLHTSSSQLNIVGSTSVQPICEQLAEEYKKSHEGVDINVQGGGTGLGIRCADDSLADIGMSSKEVSSDSLDEYELGREGILVVVNPNNPINDLSSKQIKDIFSGDITDWSEISNVSGKIHVVTREEGSGTLDAFKDIVMNGSNIRPDAIIQNSAGAIKQMVAQDRNAIGFVSLVHLDETLKDISIGGVKCSENSIKDGTYELQRPFLLLTNKNPDNETMEFIDWSLSNESQVILESKKIIRTD